MLQRKFVLLAIMVINIAPVARNVAPEEVERALAGSFECRQRTRRCYNLAKRKFGRHDHLPTRSQPGQWPALSMATNLVRRACQRFHSERVTHRSTARRISSDMHMLFSFRLELPLGKNWVKALESWTT